MKENKETVTGIRESQSVDVDSFEQTVDDEVTTIKQHLAEGTFDNQQTTIGLEYELYAVDAEDAQLRRVPRSVLACLSVEREIGLHNAELVSDVQPCNGAGLRALRHGTQAKLQTLQRLTADEGIQIVSDGMWTIGPKQNTTERYLTQATHEEGLTLAINISNAVRYHGFGSIHDEYVINGAVDLPGLTIAADNAGPVSLTTSIQPHFQPRRAVDLPTYQRSALRAAGPLVALTANSPFVPPELYDEELLGRDLLLERTHAETRIPVYEGMMNAPDKTAKVQFPADLNSVEEAVDRIAADPVIVPATIEADGRFDDQFVHFRHKHGSYWRWVRPVFDGADETTANARIEFRPIPAQPTIPDTIAVVATVTGLLTALPAHNHPVLDLAWETARENFYAAARDGLAADLTWITADGEQTTATDRLYEDLFAAAVEGLVEQGIDQAAANRFVAPLRERVDRRRTPTSWKRSIVERELDAGAAPDDAVHRAQREYIATQTETLFDGTLADWPSL